ncbi:unnamed protein product, partial [Amoebophrya sp. A120]
RFVQAGVPSVDGTTLLSHQLYTIRSPTAAEQLVDLQVNDFRHDFYVENDMQHTDERMNLQYYQLNKNYDADSWLQEHFAGAGLHNIDATSPTSNVSSTVKRMLSSAYETEGDCFFSR